MTMSSAVITIVEGPDGASVDSRSSDPNNTIGQDAESTSRGSSSSNNKSKSSRTQEPPPVVVNKETRNVYCAKLVMIGVLSMTAVASAMSTYLFLSNEANGDFEEQFKDYASEVVEVSQTNADDLFKSFESLSLGLMVYAEGAKEQWPFVTLPLFEAQVTSLLDIGTSWVSLVTLVEEDERKAWEDYSVANQDWRLESSSLSSQQNVNQVSSSNSITPFIYRTLSEEGERGEPFRDEVSPNPFYAPMWQTAPASNATYYVNFNQFDNEEFFDMFDKMQTTKTGLLSGAKANGIDFTDVENWPHLYVAQPVYETSDANASLVGIVTAYLPFHVYVKDILPEGVNGMILVLKQLCDGRKEADLEYTYQINGPNAILLGEGDLHSRPTWTLHEYAAEVPAFKTVGNCTYSMHIFPSDEFFSSYDSSKPALYTSIVVFIFFVTGLVFTWYDCSVDRRQDKVVTTAARTTAIVDSFFPSHVRDRIMNGEEAAPAGTDSHAASLSKVLGKEILGSKPIADLFPNSTIMFADIVGFTAWSSTREPSQVFTLLETIYNSFDKIAKRRRIFKVETIGDCYVAAAGLPEAREDHAILMCRFARDCLFKLQEVVNQLEISLGPDTADLGTRFGIHSGPVTGGVLRGDKSRFQLFGDTVNTAARIESTGARNKIQLSADTANLVKEAGYEAWIEPRKELVVAKGKGEMQTYWLLTSSSSASGGTSDTGILDGESDDLNLNLGEELDASGKNGKEERLIGWNVEILQRLLKQIMAMRGQDQDVDSSKLKIRSDHHETVLDEVQEIITLPSKPTKYKRDPASIELNPMAISQLTEYIRAISSLYNNLNPFHNFQHASHVTQSVIKLLSRIATMDEIDYNTMAYKKKKTHEIHNYTYGITSDPLTQFACAFSAIIHDVNHPGVPNAVLIKEKANIAGLYKNKSVAEQNSVDIAWNVLMEPRYEELRKCIYTTQDELDRFRQLVVNSVMATDIVDKELGALRKTRWAKAFHVDETQPETLQVETETDVNRKATIVIEHLIQAADVAHTMQHWHIYLKWNQRFFDECYKQFLEGRVDKNPADGWYKGEMGFYDFYIIPLAKKLDQCGVFGVSSDECLNYAMANRREWELKGKDIVDRFVQDYHRNLNNQ